MTTEDFKLLKVECFQVLDGIAGPHLDTYMFGLALERVINFERKQGIHWQTLHAFVKEWAQDRIPGVHYSVIPV